MDARSTAPQSPGGKRANLKRKRRAGDGAGPGKQREQTKEVSIPHKLHHSVQTVARAAKKARTFEIQKLVRKVKAGAGKAATTTTKANKQPRPLDPEEQAELAAILEALKHVDTERLATEALRSRLSKDKTGLQHHPAVKEFCDAHAHATPQDGGEKVDPKSARGKACNRVLANKVVAECLSQVITTLRTKAGTAADKQHQTTTASTNKAAGDGLASTSTLRGIKEKPSMIADKKKELPRSKAAKLDDETSSEEDSDIATDDDDFRDSDLEEDEDDVTVSHISAEEDMLDDDQEEFGGFGDDSRNPDSDFSGSEDDEELEVDESGRLTSQNTLEGPAKKAKKSKTSKSSPSESKMASATGPPTTSAFLPSLAGGYTLGDSDGSVYSDSDNDGAGSVKPERKNRRGQRARQAIWERKYGKNAKHVIKKRQLEQATEENRKRTLAEKHIEALKKSGRYIYGVDSNLTEVGQGKEKRVWAAQSDPAAPSGDASRGSHTDGDQDKKKTKTTTTTTKQPTEAKGMHPSWEAKKKAKEAQALLNAKPAGKKIVFD